MAEVLGAISGYISFALGLFNQYAQNDSPASRDRRGIDNNGRLPRRKITDLFYPENDNEPERTSTSEPNRLVRRFSLRRRKTFPAVPLTTEDGRIASFNGKAMWPLGDNNRESWIDLEQIIDAVIAATPAEEYQFTPRVLVEAYEIGHQPNTAQPTILISCTSQSYAKSLVKRLRHSGHLNTDSGMFKVVVRSPHDAEEWR